jgi:threonine/homoserine/homoserine lactone efflux protein
VHGGEWTTIGAMDGPAPLALFLAAALLLAVTPGPGLADVVAREVARSAGGRAA